MHPPDSAEQRVHFNILSCLGPQQEHILWDTEGTQDHSLPRCSFTRSASSHSQHTGLPSRALTQLVKVGLGTSRARHRADQPGLEEGAPFVHQHPLATSIILWWEPESAWLHTTVPTSFYSTLGHCGET